MYSLWLWVSVFDYTHRRRRHECVRTQKHTGKHQPTGTRDSYMLRALQAARRHLYAAPAEAAGVARQGQTGSNRYRTRRHHVLKLLVDSASLYSVEASCSIIFFPLQNVQCFNQNAIRTTTNTRFATGDRKGETFFCAKDAVSERKLDAG